MFVSDVKGLCQHAAACGQAVRYFLSSGGAPCHWLHALMQFRSPFCAQVTASQRVALTLEALTCSLRPDGAAPGTGMVSATARSNAVLPVRDGEPDYEPPSDYEASSGDDSDGDGGNAFCMRQAR